MCCLSLPRFGGGGPPPDPDAALPDTAEKVQISSLSLLKMLKHGRAGVPMEVMGLMLGQFVDEYTITCVDVFAMPQVRGRGPVCVIGMELHQHVCHVVLSIHLFLRSTEQE